MIDDIRREAFRSRGMIRVEGLLPADKVAEAREAVMRGLERQGVHKSDSWDFADFD